MINHSFRSLKTIGLGLLWQCVAMQIFAQAPLPPELEDPQCLGINKEPFHACLMPYATEGQALAADRHASPFSLSLNGQWKFNWVPHPAQRPVDFYRPDFDDRHWREIPVPSNWQIQGYGTPFYRNNGYTFQKDWPHVLTEPPKEFTAYVERDPVGSYRRTFAVPADWAGRRVFIDFDGVDSAFFLWVNGAKVGFSVNSRNAAEFDLTKYLQPGTNLLAVEVYTYSAGSYIEDQDMWRLSGIFRNVTLWSSPAAHVRDFFVQPELDAEYRDATLTATAKVRNYADTPAPARELRLELFDARGHAVGKTRTVVPALQPGEEQAVRLSLPVASPAKWTAETPYLYTTVLKLGQGRDAEFISTRTGFRKVEIKGRVFTINGVPVKLKGANRHENWPDTGHYVSEEHMIRDLELLKQGNCNHVRTCHYSDDPRWYELCDEYGIYLTAEANCECHGYYNVLDREPQYEKAIVDRSVANVENFKNHPSIIMWSLGNECGGGTNFVAARNAVKRLDSSRPVHYEPFGIGVDNPADVDSRMYPSLDSVKQVASDSRYTKPYYFCEFTHAMFNSMGSLAEYNALIDQYPALMGGAIWEWEDQGIWNRRDPQRQFLAYGGGFGDFPNDHYFIHKGVVFSDRTPKPHYAEMKRVFQWIQIQPDATTTNLVIRNHYAFINLDQFEGAWTLAEDGVVIDHGALPKLAVPPGGERTVSLPVKSFAPKPGAAYFLRVGFALARAQKWAPAGYEMAAQEFPFPATTPALVTDPAGMPPLEVNQLANSIVLRGQGFTISFGKAEGTISELTRDGANLLLPGGGPQLHLWRAPHRNDDLWAYQSWQSYGLDQLKRTVQGLDVTRLGPSSARVQAVVEWRGRQGFSVRHTAVYFVYGDGSLAVDNVVQPSIRKVPLARLGVRLLLDRRLDQFCYFGRGPMENYADRKTGSDIGFYQSSVREQMTPYAKPMECGNHEDVRWAALGGEGSAALMVQADEQSLQVSALPYTDEVMTPVEYSVDLPPSTNTVLTIAARTLGVGSASCGPRPGEKYIVWSEPASFSYDLKLLPAGKLDFRSVGRLALPAGRSPLTVPPEPMPVGPVGKVVAASSFEDGEGNPEHAVDGDVTTYWHSHWSSPEAPPPHFLVIDYGRELALGGLLYTARADGENGHVKDYEVYVSPDGQTWNSPVAKGCFDRAAEVATVRFAQPVQGRYLKFVALSEQNGRAFASVAELQALEAGSPLLKTSD